MTDSSWFFLYFVMKNPIILFSGIDTLNTPITHCNFKNFLRLCEIKQYIGLNTL
jgi:hypothetical protein